MLEIKLLFFSGLIFNICDYWEILIGSNDAVIGPKVACYAPIFVLSKVQNRKEIL